MEKQIETTIKGLGTSKACIAEVVENPIMENEMDHGLVRGFLWVLSPCAHLYGPEVCSLPDPLKDPKNGTPPI